MPKGYKQLCYDERVVISHMLRQGHSQAEIARQLKRSEGTISREIKRNRIKSSGNYYPIIANRKMLNRCKRAKHKLTRNNHLRSEMIRRLQLTQSPEQIMGALARLHGYSVISHETIYRYIYSDEGKELRLHQFLRFNKRCFRKKQGTRGSNTKVKIRNHQSIHTRPKVVNTRKAFGHWECDLVMFRRGIKRNLLVLRERLSRFIVAAINPSKEADITASHIINILKTFPTKARQSVTFDNDLAFAAHEKLQSTLSLDTYFCDPYKSCQKGSIE